MSHHGAFTALVLSGLLVLSACSSGKPASPVAVRVGSVVHVGHYTQVFASPLPANPARAAVVEGFGEGQVLWEKSENARHLVPPVRRYVTGQALTHLAAAVKAGKARDLVPAGVDRFFMTRVTAITGRNAIIATCDDGSKFREQNPRTGKVDAAFLPSRGRRTCSRPGGWFSSAGTGRSPRSRWLPFPAAAPSPASRAWPGPRRRVGRLWRSCSGR